MQIIQGAVAVVTGAASGLGQATAKMLTDKGAVVAGLDRVFKDFQHSHCNNTGPQVLYTEVPADVSDANSMEEAFVFIRREFGVPRILINCAGVLGSSRVFQVDKETKQFSPKPLENFRRVIGINLIGTFNAIRLFVSGIHSLNLNAEQTNGVIINTASVAAYEGLSGQTAYAASKAGIVSMTLPLARELARFGIRVVSIAPGIFETSLAAGMPDATHGSLIADVPFPRRGGQPSEFAAFVLSVIENDMLNGSTHRIDGATRMREPHR